MNYIYDKESNKYYSKNGRELRGCARDNCEIHRLGGWNNVSGSIAIMLETIKIQDKQIRDLKVVLNSVLGSNLSQAQNFKKF